MRRLFKRSRRTPKPIPVEKQVDVPVSFRGCEFLLPRHWMVAIELLDGDDYEPWVLDYFLSLCTPGTRVLDIGASWGGFALPAAKAVGKDGRVTAIEMLPDNCRILLQSARRSGLADTIRLLPIGVSDAFGAATIQRNLRTNNQIVSEPRPDEPLKGYEVLPVVPLDLVRSEIGPIDLVKMDIEGMEHRAVLGGLKLFEENRPIIFVEYSPAFQQNVSGADGSALLRLFLKMGYSPEILHRKAPRERVGGGDDNAVIAHIDAAWRLHCERDNGTHLDLCLTPSERL